MATWALTQRLSVPTKICPLCRRPLYHATKHHLIPKSEGGTEREPLCRDCHRAVHVTFTNRELAEQYHTVAALLAHDGLRRMVRFIAKQDGRVKMVRPRAACRRRY